MIDFRVSPRYLDCAAAADGQHHCSLDFVSFVYSDDGDLLVTQSNSVRVNLSPSQFASVQNSFFRYRQQIGIPVKGESYLRVGMRDASTGRLGALELPVAAVTRLTPIAAAPASSTAPAPQQK